MKADQAIPDRVLEGKGIERKYVDRRSQARVAVAFESEERPADDHVCQGNPYASFVNLLNINTVFFAEESQTGRPHTLSRTNPVTLQSNFHFPFTQSWEEAMQEGAIKVCVAGDFHSLSLKHRGDLKSSGAGTTWLMTGGGALPHPF